MRSISVPTFAYTPAELRDRAKAFSQLAGQCNDLTTMQELRILAARYVLRASEMESTSSLTDISVGHPRLRPQMGKDRAGREISRRRSTKYRERSQNFNGAGIE